MILKLDEMKSNRCPIVIHVPGNVHAGALIVISHSFKTATISTLLHKENLGNNAIKSLYAILCSTFFIIFINSEYKSLIRFMSSKYFLLFYQWCFLFLGGVL